MPFMHVLLLLCMERAGDPKNKQDLDYRNFLYCVHDIWFGFYIQVQTKGKYVQQSTYLIGVDIAL